MIDYSSWTKEMMLDEIYNMAISVKYFEKEIQKRHEDKK